MRNVAPVDCKAAIPDVISWIASASFPASTDTQPWCKIAIALQK